MFSLQDYHVCNGTCLPHTTPCQGVCQSPDYYLCRSGDECYRYWDYCDNEKHCRDGSDEGTICLARDYVVYFVPVLMMFLIASLLITLLVLRLKNNWDDAGEPDQVVRIAKPIQGNRVSPAAASINHLAAPSNAIRLTSNGGTAPVPAGEEAERMFAPVANGFTVTGAPESGSLMDENDEDSPECSPVSDSSSGDISSTDSTMKHRQILPTFTVINSHNVHLREWL